RVGLGRLGDGLGEGADLPRVGDRNRQAGPGEGRSYNALQAAGGLEHDEVGLQNLETRHEVVEPGTSTRHGKIFTTWTHGNIEAVLRYVDTNGDLLHGDPSLLGAPPARSLRDYGIEGVLADALDAQAVDAALRKVRPAAVIDELTSLPRHYTRTQCAPHWSATGA